MPTYMDVPTLAGNTASHGDGNGAEDDEGSITILHGDESTIVDENYCPDNKNNNNNNTPNINKKDDHYDAMSPHISRRGRNNDKSVTFDDSMILMSIGSVEVALHQRKNHHQVPTIIITMIVARKMNVVMVIKIGGLIVEQSLVLGRIAMNTMINTKITSRIQYQILNQSFLINYEIIDQCLWKRRH
jgi:hypothetical protein